jgi:dolichol-phosphate mannosyltransferase
VPDISVVVAVYNCGDCLLELHRRLVRSVAEITDSFEVIYVDDRSMDSGWEVLDELAARDDRVRIVRLSRNFGQHAALTAGLAESGGDWTVVLDCDLQDPPEEIGRLYEEVHKGFDLVLARRIRKGQPRVRRWTSSLYFKLLNVFTGAGVDGEFGTFSILSRKVRDSYLQLGEHDRHYLFILLWLGFRRGIIDFEQSERFSGGSSYSLGKLVRHALSGVFFQTTNLLVWVTYAGFAIAGTGASLALYLVYLRLAHRPPEGWVSLAALNLVIGGFIIVSTGVTGLYVGRVFHLMKRRPLYVIDVARGRRAEGSPPSALTKSHAPTREHATR